MRNPAKLSGRRIAGAALIAALGLAASACAGGGSTGSSAASTSSPLPTVSGPVTITFQEVYGTKTQLATITKVVDAFEAKYPNITVQLQPSSNYTALFEKENAEVAAGNTPTIGMAYEDNAETWSTAQKIVPISQLAGSNSPAELSTFYTGIQDDLKLSDGNLWMWPLGKSLQLQAINETQFAAAGISSAPTTWAQWASDLQTVTAKNKSSNSKHHGLPARQRRDPLRGGRRDRRPAAVRLRRLPAVHLRRRGQGDAVPAGREGERLPRGRRLDHRPLPR
jgi:ABC-type glycerol-3-phosphate transport system substrate-binding protein